MEPLGFCYDDETEALPRTEGEAQDAEIQEDVGASSLHRNLQLGLRVEFRVTHRPLSSSFLGLRYRIPNMNHEKELLRGLWVRVPRV